MAERADLIIKPMEETAASLSYRQLYEQINKEIERTTDLNKFDVIVLGVGTMGSSTCYHLAKNGYKVLGLEQFDIPHEQGSHTGQSRIIRKAYGEASNYVPLLERAYKNWKTLESETGSQVYYKAGLVYFGANDDSYIETVKQSAKKYNIPLHKLTKEECNRKYPQFNLPLDFQRLEEPNAGLLSPERSILLLVQQAILKGATIRTKEKVLEWKRENGLVTVKTDKGRYQAKKLVVTAGPWAGKMIPGFAPKLKITRQALAWVKPKNWADFELGKFPCWLLRDNAHNFYGFPILPPDKFGEPLGLKLGLHFPAGDVTDPDAVDRDKNESDESILVRFLNKFIPDGYEKTLVMKTCLYSTTQDENFILDYIPGFGKDVVVAAGFSGHGFKFASVVGEIMSDLAMKGATQLPIDFLNANRFD